MAESDESSLLDQLIADFLAALDRGEAPSREKLKADNPDIADQLQQFFDDLDCLPGARPDPAETADAAQASSEASPTIGDYKLLQQIGSGGMGEVWMAEQQRPIRRRVALKVIKAGMDTKQVIARFEAERQALAVMDHNNIAKVLDAGKTENGKPYFVMQLVQGIPITAYCDQNRLNIEQRLRLFLPVCHAVQHAHQKGIVHRDLKPSNILVTLYDGRPAPKVIDFGLAKALQHQSRLTDKTLFTEFGQVVGTLQYMSPEQAEMNALDVDTRTDIYSLGVLLYELLVGSTPIDAETIRQEAILSVLTIIQQKDPPRPSVRLSSSIDQITGISEQRQLDPRKLTQILKGDLDWIVMKAIEKDRTRRYSTASGFADDIERFLEGDAVEARPPSRLYQFHKFTVKNRGAVTGILGLIATLLIATIVSARFSIAASEARKNAERLSESARIYAEEQIRLREEIEDSQRSLRETQAEALLSARSAAVPFLIESIRTSRVNMKEHFRTIFDDEAADPLKRLRAAYALIDAETSPEIVKFIISCISHQYEQESYNIVSNLRAQNGVALELVKKSADRARLDKDWPRLSRLSITALHLGDLSLSIEMTRNRSDPTKRAVFIDTFPKWHGSIQDLSNVVQDCPEQDFVSAMCLAIGSLEVASLTAEESLAGKELLATLHQGSSAGSIHSAADWAIRNWKMRRPHVVETPTSKPSGWYCNPVGITMLHVDLSDTADGQLDYSLFIGDREVTARDFRRFLRDPKYPIKQKPADLEDSVRHLDDEDPVHDVNWYDSILFCNWLSSEEGLTPSYRFESPQDDALRILGDESDALESMNWDYFSSEGEWLLVPNTKGYRLPTEREWEICCRAGTTTSHSNSIELLKKYAVYLEDHVESVGSRFPNAWGLFDMHGNVREWCDPSGRSNFILRGGAFHDGLRDVSSTASYSITPRDRSLRGCGFRVVRNASERRRVNEPGDR